MFYKTMTITVFVFMLLAGLPALSPIYAEDGEYSFEAVETIDGVISGIDTEKSTITVHWMADQVMMKYQDITLKVLPKTSITKNADPLELRDIEDGDHVTVRYDPNGMPLPTAASVAVWET